MSRISRHLARALAVLMFMGILGGVAPVNAANTTPLRVLLTGDSITQGFHGDYTWRYRFAKEFARQGKPLDLVGSRTLPVVKPRYTYSQYIDPNFDKNHFAQGGSTLGQHMGWIADEVRVQKPDVIVLHCGINDLRNGASPETTRDRLRTWILAVRAVQPTVSIVISPVLDAIDPARPTLSERINNYNGLARETVTGLNTPQAPITMAETTRGWSVVAHTAENLHPNPTGETLMAQRIAETFVRLGYLSGPISIYRWTSWNRQPRVRVLVRNQRAVLSWDAQAISGARVWRRRVGHAASFPATRYGGGTMTTSALVPRATYEFRVQLIRGRTATPLGPITRVTVPAPRRPAAVSRVVVNARGISWTRSALATKYVVKFRKIRKKRWITRQTTGLYVVSPRVKQARVWAVNSAGRSPMRAGTR